MAECYDKFMHLLQELGLLFKTFFLDSLKMLHTAIEGTRNDLVLHGLTK